MARARLPGRQLCDDEGLLLALHDQAAGERVRLDDAFAAPERRLAAAAGHPVLALWRALHGEAELIAQLPAVRGVAQLERAPGIDVQVQVARDRLRAEVAVLRAHSRPVEASRGGLELHLRRRPRREHRGVAGDGVE